LATNSANRFMSAYTMILFGAIKSQPGRSRRVPSSVAQGGQVDTAARDVAARETASRAAAAQMAAAAADWLDSLENAQRAVASGGAPSPDAEADGERRRWFYTPTDHGGLTLGAQRPAQQC
jgi:hypothetical protein